MPILNKPLDANGHALIELVLSPSQARRTKLQTTSQSLTLALPVVGMIDTGASVTVIDPQIRQALSLVPFRVRYTIVPNAPDPVRVPSYKLDLGVMGPDGYFLLCPMLSVVEMPLINTGISVLVGCDVLFKCHFTHNGLSASFTLAY